MRFYRLFLRLYPTSFRNEYGADMQGILRDSLRRAGGPARLFVWLSALMDVMLNAPVVHAELLRQDLKFSIRTLSRAPGFALTVVAVTALSVGATCAVLTLADRVFIQPLPFHEPDRLVRIWESKPGYTQMELSPPNYRDWVSMSTSFEQVAAWHGAAANLTGLQRPVHLEGASVTANMLPLLGVRPLLGRLPNDGDGHPGANATVVLSEALWTQQFGADPSAVGRVIDLNNQPHIVIGVMPAFFHFPSRLAQFWTPIQFGPQAFEDRGNNYLYAIGRLKHGITAEQARNEMRKIAADLERAYPVENAQTSATVIPLRDHLDPKARVILAALCASSICFLLIACLNLTNLFLARALARRKELAIRTALGAGPERLVRQLGTEGLLLACIGGAIGFALAGIALPFLGQLTPESLPVAPPELGWRAACLALALSVGTGLFFGVVPALRICRVDAAEGLQEGARQGIGGRRQRARAALVISEVSLSMTLLVSSGLLLRALWNIQSIDPGFRSEGVLTLRTPLPMPKYEQTARRSRFYSKVVQDIEALPGVNAASYISFLPIAMGGGIWPVDIGGRSENRSENHTASLRFITPGFFEALDIPLLQGRDVRDSDTMDTPAVAVVSRSFAERYWPGQDAIGRSFAFAFAERRIVGIVRDIKVRGLERKSEPQVYLPHRQVSDGMLTFYAPKDLVVSAPVNEAELLPSIRQIIRNADPEQPVTDVQLLSELIASDTATRRLQVRLLAVFAALALLVAAVGLYGLLSYAVSQRMSEFGVRLALGARARDLFAIVMRQSFALTVGGLFLGALLAAVAARGIESLLHGVDTSDAPTWTIAIAMCLIAAMLGALWPATRAARVDALEAMRRE